MYKCIVISLIPIIGFLWALGGSRGFSKLYRRLGVGLVISLFVGLLIKDGRTFWILPLMFWATSCGYGVPDSTDEGSKMGKFWFNLVRNVGENRFNQSQMTSFLTNFLTRLTVSIFYCIALLPLLFYSNISKMFLSCIAITVNTMLWAVYLKCDNALIGNLSLEEILVGSGVGLGACLYLV